MTTEEMTQLAVVANDIKWIRENLGNVDEKLDSVCGHVDAHDGDIKTLKSRADMNFKIILITASTSLGVAGTILGLFFTHVFN